MKKYEKPSLDIVRLSLKENIANNPAGIGEEVLPDGTIVTVYDLQTYHSTPSS